MDKVTPQMMCSPVISTILPATLSPFSQSGSCGRGLCTLPIYYPLPVAFSLLLNTLILLSLDVETC